MHFRTLAMPSVSSPSCCRGWRRHSRFPLVQLKAFVEQEFAQIKHVLHGISLLGQCPDSINAALICRGEKLSIAIMAGLLEARGHHVTVIDPVENCWRWATTSNPPLILLNQPAASLRAKFLLTI